LFIENIGCGKETIYRYSGDLTRTMFNHEENIRVAELESVKIKVSALGIIQELLLNYFSKN
jgi:hypothetical protein